MKSEYRPEFLEGMTSILVEIFKLNRDDSAVMRRASLDLSNINYLCGIIDGLHMILDLDYGDVEETRRLRMMEFTANMLLMKFRQELEVYSRNIGNEYS